MDRQEAQPVTAVWRNGGFSASYDSFVGTQTVVLRINICGENPPLRQAAKRQVVKKLTLFNYLPKNLVIRGAQNE
jgi:hypothetical protein